MPNAIIIVTSKTLKGRHYYSINAGKIQQPKGVDIIRLIKLMVTIFTYL